MNARTGLTPTQTEFLAGELRAVREELPTEATVEGRGPDRQLKEGEPKRTVDVPGDGSFTLYSRKGVDSLHKKLTGKTVTEFTEAGQKAEEKKAAPTRERVTYPERASDKYYMSDRGPEGKYVGRYTEVENALPVTIKGHEDLDLFIRDVYKGEDVKSANAYTVTEGLTGTMLGTGRTPKAAIADAKKGLDANADKLKGGIERHIEKHGPSPRYRKAEAKAETPALREREAPLKMARDEDVTPGVGFPARLVKAEVRNFSREVDAVLAGTAGTHEATEVMSQAPPLLRRLGLRDAEIVMPQSVVRKAVGAQGRQHDIDPEVLKRLPAELNDPVMVFDSLSERGALVVLTGLQNRRGLPVVAVVAVSRESGGRAVNVIPSAHEKDRLRFVTDWARRGALRYAHSEKANDWLRQSGLQLSGAEARLLAGNNILTEADFVQKMARADKSVDELKAADFTDLVPAAEVKRDGHLLEVNAEGHEILRRAFEQNLIRAGQEEGPAESAFDGVFINREQVRETVRSLKNAAKEMRESGYEEAEAKRLDGMAADLIAAAREGKGTAVAYLFDYAIPHEEFHRAGYLGAIEEALSQRHASFTELAAHPAIQKAWDTYFNRVEGYARTDEALLVEETAAWIAGGKAETLGLSEDEAVDYLDKWFESYAERNGDDALLNFAEVGLTHVREIIGQVRERRADRGRGQERVQGRGAGVRGAPQRPREAPGGDTAGASEGQPEKGQVARRALPETLREQGLQAADELYEIYPDKAATADAKKLLEDLGFEGAVRLLESDIQHGAEHVQLSKILQRALLAEASNLSTTDTAEAAKLRSRQQELASALSARMTRGGQFIRGAQVLDSSAEDVMATAAKVAKERGRKLTTEEAERVHKAGEELEQASAALEVSAREVADKRREAEGIEEAQKRAEEGALTKREIEALRKRLVSLREKEKRREQKVADLESQIPRKPRKPPVRKAPREIAADALGAEESELLADLQAALGMGGPLMMARARALTQTEAFKNWFDGSKVVDEKGSPLVVYHGTTEDVSRFSGSKAGLKQGNVYAGRSNFFFTDSTAAAGDYAQSNVNPAYDRPNVMPAYLSLQNPFEVDAKGDSYFNVTANAIKQARKEGHDGVIIRNVKDFGGNEGRKQGQINTYIAFEPTQIKSATGNRGTFDPSDPNILKMARAEGDTAQGKAQPQPSLDKATLDKLARLGALKLLRAERGTLTVADLKRDLVRDFGERVRPHVDAIHARAVRIARAEVRKAHHEKVLDSISRREGNEDLSRKELEEIAQEEREARRRAALVQREHERVALKAEGPKQGPKLSEAKKAGPRRVIPDALAQAIARNAKTDEEASAAARILAGFADKDAVRVGGPLLEAARKEVRASQEMAAALKARTATTQAEMDRALADLQQARRDRAAAHSAVARELERIRKGKLRQMAGGAFRETKGVMIALQASGDMSNLLRQGGIPAMMQPQIFPEFAKATLKSVREAGFAKNIDVIERGADFALKQRMGIDFAFAGGKSQGEEFFEGADILQRIPIVKQTVGKYVQKSDEVFGGGLDHLRSSLADLWIDQLRSQGVTYREHPEAYKAVGRFINIITGRADIGPHNTAVTRALLSVTKLIGFSPRYRLSRIQFLTLPFNASFYQAHPAARRIVYKNVARYYATLGGTLGALSALGYLTGLATVGLLDPEDDEWLKVKIGDLRLDLTAGNQTQARTAFRLIGEGYRVATGEITGEMGAEKSVNIASRWLRSGADPRASLAADWWTGETFTGEPFKWGGLDGAIATRLMPISAANVVKTMQKEGPAMAAAQGAADFVGIGSQVYPDRQDEPKTKAERLAARFAAKDMKGGKPRTEEMRRKLDELKGRARKGEDVRGEVEPLVASGEITEGHGESIVKAKDQTLLQEKIRQLSLEDARHVLKYATAEEIESVKPILRAKALNEAEKKAREERKRANPAKAEADRRKSERAGERKRRRQEVRYGREVSP